MMLAAVPSSVLGPVLPGGTSDIVQDTTQQQMPSPEDLVNAFRTQAEATERLLMPMNGQGALPGVDGTGLVYRPLSMLANNSNPESVTGLSQGGGAGALLSQLPDPSGPVAERLERNVMQLQLARGTVGPQAGIVSIGDNLKDRGGAGVDDAIRNGKLHLSLASQHNDVVTSVVTEVHMAAQRIIHDEMEKRKNDMYERLRSKLLHGEVPSTGINDGVYEEGKKVKGQVPESSRRILELLTKPKTNSPEVFDSIVKLDCQDGNAEKSDLWSAFEWTTSARDPVPPANAHQFIAGSLGYLNDRFIQGLISTVYSSGRPYASSGRMRHPKSHAERLDLTFQYGRIIFDDNNFPYSHLHEVWFALYTAVRANFVSVVETLCSEPSLLVACPPLGFLGKALVSRMASVKGTGGQQCSTPTGMADFDDGTSGPLQVLLALVDQPIGEDGMTSNGVASSGDGPVRLTAPDFSISRVLPNCTAEDWTWFNLMECLHPSFSTVETLTKLQLVQDKIANLPSEYFDDPLDAPSGGPPGSAAPMALADSGPTYHQQRRAVGGGGRSKGGRKASWKLAKLLLLSLQFPRSFAVLSGGSEAQETTAIWMRLYIDRPHGSGIITALRSSHLEEEGESDSTAANAVMHYAQKRFTIQETLRFLPALKPRCRVEVLRELLLSHTESNANGGAEVIDEIVGFIDPDTGEVHRGLLHSSALASVMDEKASGPSDSSSSSSRSPAKENSTAAAITNGSSGRQSMFGTSAALALPTAPGTSAAPSVKQQQSVYVETCRYCGRCAVDMGQHGLGMKLLHCAGEYNEVVTVMVRCLTSPALVQEISEPSSSLLAIIEMLMKIYDANPRKWGLDMREWDEAKRLYSLLQFERLCSSGRYEEAITHFDRHQLLGANWDRRTGGARASIARRVLNAYVPLLVHAQKSASRDVIRDRVIELQRFVSANVPEDVMRQVSPSTLRALSELSVYLQ